MAKNKKMTLKDVARIKKTTTDTKFITRIEKTVQERQLTKTKNERDKQLNPNNDAYWKSRGKNKRPTNWQNLIG